MVNEKRKKQTKPRKVKKSAQTDSETVADTDTETEPAYTKKGAELMKLYDAGAGIEAGCSGASEDEGEKSYSAIFQPPEKKR